ncbi:hypothetical protein RFM23_21075 [Mesorhizobium abyssinicae]|uniref:Uncharacterized protein n=1 Tax=Mesorhizobium abyssinicae TaxID=1209958 RepID=A0ABU5ASA6_9HYPH|nr:hypothetical protein [Mesorhizobium abyssinicae]MDX8540116.1 hypothetical protein [Mesorhizobium abyssinicae]
MTSHLRLVPHLDLIEDCAELLDFLIARLRVSLPEVFTFRHTLEDIDEFVEQIRSEKCYRPFDNDRMNVELTLHRAICSEESEVVCCGKGLLEFFALVQAIADHHNRTLALPEIARVALIALGAEKTVAFDGIIDESGAKTNVLVIASEPQFEEKYGVRIRIITKIERPLRSRKSKRGGQMSGGSLGSRRRPSHLRILVP